MIHPAKSRFLILAGLSASAIALAACGSSGSSDESSAPAESASASASASTSASESAMGGTVLPPVMVADDATSATAKVGDTVVFAVEDPVNTKIATTDTTLLEITQGYTDGSATFNPGAKALAAGTATVTVTEPDEPVRTVTVTIG